MSEEYHSHWSDHDPHDADEFEFDDESVAEDDLLDDDDDVVSCPACHRDVHELADRCPHCGEYITLGNQPWAFQSPSRQRFIKWALLLMLAALLLPFLIALGQLLIAAVSR